MKFKILLILVIITFFSCSDDTEIISDTEKTINENLRIPGYNYLFDIFYISGRSFSIYVDGFRIGSDCIGIGFCKGPFFSLSSDNGTAVTMEILEESQLELTILEETESLEEIEEILHNNDGDISQAESIFSDIKQNVVIDEPIVVVDQDILENLIPEYNDEIQMTILPGEYEIDYSENEFGKFRLDISLENN